MSLTVNEAFEIARENNNRTNAQCEQLLQWLLDKRIVIQGDKFLYNGGEFDVWCLYNLVFLEWLDDNG